MPHPIPWPGSGHGYTTPPPPAHYEQDTSRAIRLLRSRGRTFLFYFNFLRDNQLINIKTDRKSIYLKSTTLGTLVTPMLGQVVLLLRVLSGLKIFVNNGFSDLHTCSCFNFGPLIFPKWIVMRLVIFICFAF